MPEKKNENRERKVRQRKLGERLREMYDDVTSEPVPDDFMKLLEEADKSDGSNPRD